jgi:uncharacterized protein YjbJ (UPF0337 family)
MNKFRFDGSWNEIKGKLRQKYGQLADDDLQFAEGKGEEFLGRLQSRLGIGADELHKTLNDIKHEVAGAAGTGHGKFETAKQKVSEVAHDAKAKLTEVAGDLKHGAVEQAEHLKEKAGEVYEDARLKVRSWHEDGGEYVREQPRTALLTALAVGFVIGLLIRR